MFSSAVRCRLWTRFPANAFRKKDGCIKFSCRDSFLSSYFVDDSEFTHFYASGEYEGGGTCTGTWHGGLCPVLWFHAKHYTGAILFAAFDHRSWLVRPCR